MNKEEKKKLKQRMDALAKQHGKILNQELILQVFNLAESLNYQGKYLELTGARSGEDFFEFAFKVHTFQ